ncbi:MAG: potassium-transporting ATPase subunit A [Planctomycetes bacterium]|nr:potassium-transporting ATPase subunit A [Planctomycetota bacterium]
MTRAWIEIAATLAMALVVAVAIVPWLTALLPTERPLHGLLGRVAGAIERRLLGAAGAWPARGMRPGEYAASLVVLHAVGFVVLLGVLRLQGLLPWNPQGLPAVPWGIAVNTVVSFVTNTNWQSYAGETTLSPFSQVFGLTVQNFIAPAMGIATMFVVARGFVLSGSGTVGNCWQDVVRAAVMLLLPLAVLLSALLVREGAAQTLGALSGPAGGPVASQTAIALVGSNGGGYFNANSAHPLATPTPLANALQIAFMLALPIAACLAFGRWIADRRQGRAILLANALLFLPPLALLVTAETAPNRALPAGIAQGHDADHDGGSLEGKEARFGTGASALFVAAATATSTGAVDAMHDSLSPLGGFVALWFISLGEVVFGGVGTGLAGLVAYALLAVFVAGLMVGRSPEYLGKRIEAREMKLAMLALLVPPVTTLLGTAVAAVRPAMAAAAPNPGPHGFSELLYAFASAANNNGSAFAGLDAASLSWTLGLAAAMAAGRMATIVCLVLLGGSLAAKRPVAVSSGTLPTHGPLFILMLAGAVVLVGALAFLPALALGPLAEALEGPLGGTR